MENKIISDIDIQTTHIGKIIRARRKALNLTIAKASELCDISDRGLIKIELGDCDPQWSTVMKIAEALAINLWDRFKRP